MASRRRPSPRETCAARGLPLQVFPWTTAARRAGLRRGAAYLVRPDGYVGLADPEASPARLESYLDRRGIRPAASPPAAG